MVGGWAIAVTAANRATIDEATMNLILRSIVYPGHGRPDVNVGLAESGDSSSSFAQPHNPVRPHKTRAPPRDHVPGKQDEKAASKTKHMIILLTRVCHLNMCLDHLYNILCINVKNLN